MKNEPSKKDLSFNTLPKNEYEAEMEDLAKLRLKDMAIAHELVRDIRDLSRFSSYCKNEELYIVRNKFTDDLIDLIINSSNGPYEFVDEYIKLNANNRNPIATRFVFQSPQYLICYECNKSDNKNKAVTDMIKIIDCLTNKIEVYRIEE